MVISCGNAAAAAVDTLCWHICQLFIKAFTLTHPIHKQKIQAVACKRACIYSVQTKRDWNIFAEFCCAVRPQMWYTTHWMDVNFFPSPFHSTLVNTFDEATQYVRHTMASQSKRVNTNTHTPVLKTKDVHNAHLQGGVGSHKMTDCQYQSSG